MDVREEVAGGGKKLHNENRHGICYSPSFK
jgi:hypothetical protein